MTAQTQALRMSERQLQDAVIELAQRLHYRVAHFRPARVTCPACKGIGDKAAKGGGWYAGEACKACKGTGMSWATAVQADGAGFPDLVLVRDRVVFVELKSDKGRLSPAQKEWRDTLIAAGCEWHIWAPKDWIEEIERILRG